MHNLGKLVCAALLGRAAVAASGSLRWEVADSGSTSPPARRHAALGYDRIRRRVILYGGRAMSDGTVLGDTWVYDTESASWQELQPSGDEASPPARFSMVYGTAQAGALDAFYVSTGESAKFGFFNDVWALNLSSLTWSEQPASGPAPTVRYGSGGGIDPLNPTHLTVTHGFSDRRYSDSFAFDLKHSVWTDISQRDEALRPFARCLHAGAVAPGSGASTVIWGGCGSGGHGPCPAGDAWRLDPSREAGSGPPALGHGTWAQLPSCPAPAIYPAAAPLPGTAQRVVVIGGNGGSLFGGAAPGSRLSVLHTATGEWRVVEAGGESFPPVYGVAAALAPNSTAAVPAHSSLAPSADDAVYAFGGEEQGRLWRLTGADTDGLTALPCGPGDDGWRMAHGVLMTLSWGILLPVGVTIARFGRGQGHIWFLLHRAIQITGLLLATGALVCAIMMVQVAKFSALPHATLGIAIMVLGLQQPINAFIRPHKAPGHPTSRLRLAWELLHKNVGRVACLLGLANPFQGLRFLGAGTYAVTLYSVWVASLATFWVVMTLAGRPGKENPSPLADCCRRAIARLCACCRRKRSGGEERTSHAEMVGGADSATPPQGSRSDA